MNPILFGALVIGVMSIAVLAAYISNTLEQNRKLKQRMLDDLSTNVNEADNYLYNIPPCYLPTEIRQFLMEFLEVQYRSLLSVDPKNSTFKDSINNLQTLKTEPYTHNPDPKGLVFSDVITARNSAERVRDMTNFLVRLHNQGLVNKEDAKKLVNQSKVMYLLSKTETDLIAAKHIAKQGKPKVALLRYAECTERLKIFEAKNQLPNRRRLLDRCIDETNEQIQATLARISDTAPELKEQGKWDDFDTNKEGNADWQVKQSYD